MATQKMCLRCGEEYLAKKSNQKYCPVCGPLIRKEQIRTWIATHLERQKFLCKRWAGEHPEKMAAFSATHYINNKQAEIARSQINRWARKIANPEREKALRHKQNAKHYANNREKCIALAGAWAKANPDKVAVRRQKRRVEKYGNTQIDRLLTATEWTETKEYFDHRCAYCGRQPEKLTIDHIVPLSRGGAHTKENIVPACRSCNSSKHNSSLLVYLLRRD